MAAYIKFNCVSADKWLGKHNLASHELRVMLTNTAPVAANSVTADITEIAAGNGYSAGGILITVTSAAQTGGVFKLVLADSPVLSASGGSIGPFRYAVLRNATTAGGPLLGAWDYGSALTLTDGGPGFQVDFNDITGVLTDTFV